MRKVIITITAATLGLAAGVLVTHRAHRAPLSPSWATRVGRTRLRRSDLPVGGTLALLAASVLRLAGKRRPATVVAALGIGAAAGAIGTGLIDPLAPIDDAATDADGDIGGYSGYIRRDDD